MKHKYTFNQGNKIYKLIPNCGLDSRKLDESTMSPEYVRS